MVIQITSLPLAGSDLVIVALGLWIGRSVRRGLPWVKGNPADACLAAKLSQNDIEATT